MEITLHTGSQGAHTTLHVDWFDEDGVGQVTDIDIIVQDQDKPRTLEIRINGAVVAVIQRR